MSTSWNAAEVVENALRNIGSYSVYDSGADPEAFRIGLERFDSLCAELVATKNLWWFEVFEQEITLTANTAYYFINSVIDSPLNYLSNAHTTFNGENLTPVELLRYEYLEEKKVEHPNSNSPEYVMMERMDTNPKLYVWGIPNVEGWKLHLRGRKFSENMQIDGGSITTEFPKAFNLCLSYLLGADLGNGAVTKLPKGERVDMKAEGEEKLDRLMISCSKENIKTPRYTRVRDF
jgi:hypothetical protein